MTLTPSDVEAKTFGTALRGYDLGEVDEFLEEVADTIRELHEQLAECKASARAATLQPTPRLAAEPKPAPALLADESSVGRALVVAQTAADQLLEDADREKERIVDEAKAEAESLLSERDAQKVVIEAEMNELSEHVSGVRARLAVLSGAVSDLLDEMDEALDHEEALGAGETKGSLVGVDENQETSTYDLDDSDERESEGEDSSGDAPASEGRDGVEDD